jgi:hypothetical protein
MSDVGYRDVCVFLCVINIFLHALCLVTDPLRSQPTAVGFAFASRVNTRHQSRPALLIAHAHLARQVCEHLVLGDLFQVGFFFSSLLANHLEESFKTIAGSRACTAATVCQPGQYQTVALTATSNRVCE